MNITFDAKINTIGGGTWYHVDSILEHRLQLQKITLKNKRKLRLSSLLYKKGGKIMKLTPMLGENIVNYPGRIFLTENFNACQKKIDGVRRLFHKDNSGT